jgi:signal transduction histidine kinase
MAGRGPRSRGAWLAVSAAALAAAAVLLALSLVLPGWMSRDYDAKSLGSLRKQAVRTRQGFSSLLASLQARASRFAATDWPADPADFTPLFRSAGLDPENEGVALCAADGFLEAWYGDVLSLGDQVGPEDLGALQASGGSVLIRSKASVYAVTLRRFGEKGLWMAHFLRLAFLPQVRSTYIDEFHALRPALRGEFDIDYWDFREDVEGFEKFFARHRDEFTGQPRQKNEIQTLFFPLRNEKGRIVATVTLASPSLTSRLTVAREDLRLLLLLAFLVAGMAGLVHFWSSPGFRAGREPLSAAAGAVLLVGLRFAALPLGGLERVQSLGPFQPSVAGFLSVGGLTRSPADIFLTAATVLGLAAGLVLSAGRRRREAPSGQPSLLRGLAAHAAAAVVAAAGVLLFCGFVRRVVFNANLALLRWDLSVSRLALQLGLVVAFVAILILLAVAFRLAFPDPRTSWASGLAGALAAAAAVLAGSGASPLLAAASAALVAWVFAAAVVPGLARRREVWLLGLVLGSFWLARAIDDLSADRTRRLLETTIAHAIQTQETWGHFLIEESLPGLERNERQIVAFLKDPRDPDFAYSLWERSPVAKSSWNSSLEVRDPEGGILSRFSLNVPKVLTGPPELAPAEDWAIVPYELTFIGKSKGYLVGYRDYVEGDAPVGRVALYVSLDPEMLPFLHSANPYFEVLRTDSLPSLGQIDFGCVIYDLEGRTLFDPRKLTAGLAEADLARLASGGPPFWSEFREDGKAYDAYLFRSGDRFYGLYAPQRGFRTQAVDFLRFLLLGLAAALGAALAAAFAAGRASVHKPFWSFSNRVYAAFLAVALLPLLLYTVFTRDLFDSLFTERFVEDSAVRAGSARGLLEAFLIIRGGGGSPFLDPSEDLALWISSTLSNDVILYDEEAVLLASSRGEFFASGLLPETLNGEAYQALAFERRPYFIERTRLGGYSFQTLTVPYESDGARLFVSLPFPLEREQLTTATQETVEFLTLLAAFFVVLVVLFSRGIRSMIIVPVRKLLAGTREVGLGNLEVTIEHRSRDEMMTLIDGFNTMIRNLKAHERELAEMSKKVAWTEMARKVAHEIKNPLTPIQLSAEHVLKVYEDKRGDLDQALKESMSYIISEVENLRRIAQEFMEIARDTAPAREPVDLRALLEETLEPYRRLLDERIRFRFAAEGADLRVLGDPAKLKTALRNVVANAVEAIGPRGELEASVSRRDGRVAVAIRDSGPGMSRETVERIFELYYSTKEGGTGLGLPIAKKIVEEHGGTIRVASEPGRGTTVILDLPAGG